MEIYLVKESIIERYAKAKPEFFAKVVEVDDELGKKMLEFEERVRVYRTWLRKIEGAFAGRTPAGVANALKEKPEWLDAAPEEEQPKQQDTAALSSKKSPAKRKKKAASSSTSRQKVE